MKTFKSVLLATLVLTSPMVTFANSNIDSDLEMAQTLHQAILDIDIINLNLLLAEGNDINSIDDDGNTPLMLASKIGNPRMLKIIMAHEPDVNLKNNNGVTALMIAAEYGQYHVAETLIEAGAQTGIRNNEGYTAAELARKFGHPQILTLLNNAPALNITR
jgi:ankyrin repeat protein